MFKTTALFMAATFSCSAFNLNAAPQKPEKQVQAAPMTQDEAGAKIFTALIKKDNAALDKFIDPEFVKELQANGLTKNDFYSYINKVMGALGSKTTMDPEKAVQFALAMYNGDTPTVWSMFPPEIRKQLLEKYGSEAAALDAVKAIVSEQQKQLRAELNKSMVQRNGQWYFRPADTKAAVARIKSAAAESNQPAK